MPFGLDEAIKSDRGSQGPSRRDSYFFWPILMCAFGGCAAASGV